MKKSSLSRQLVAGVLVAELICAALFSCVAVLHEMDGQRHAFDIMLRGRADSVLGAIHDAEDPEDNVTVDPTELTLPRRDAYEVLSQAGRVVSISQSSTPALLRGLESSHTAGYFNFRAGREHYRALRFNGVRIVDREEEKGGLRRPVTILYASPSHGLWHEALEAVEFYVISSVLLLVATGAALVWFLRIRLAPLQDLARIAARVSVTSWDFVPPATVLHTAELAPIATSIDELIMGLRQSFDRQRQLTGDAAHELKTSIAVLKSSVQLLSMNPREVSQYESGLEGLLLDTERMEDLANRMLVLARLEEAPVVSHDSSDLRSSAQIVAERMRPLADLKDVKLEVSTGEPCIVDLPADEAEVLCSNLILNALQHSLPSASVFIGIRNFDHSVELRVVDQGDGIPETALPHVFDRFFRADRSRSRNSGGAGLGLSICKAIVDRANGSIRIQSTVGKGTEVTVLFSTAQMLHVPS